MSLENRVIVITGSSKGLGFSIAKEFSEKCNATAIVCSRDIERANKAKMQIKGNVFSYQLDVTDSNSIDRFIQQVLSNHGRIDILVNNAGFPFEKNIWYKHLHEITEDELNKILNVDLKGSFRMSNAVIRSILDQQCNKNKNGPKIINGSQDIKINSVDINNDDAIKTCQNNGAVIVNISSTPAIAGHTEGSPYTIAKSAIIGLTKCIAMEYGIYNIRAYTLALGDIATSSTYDSMTEKDRINATQKNSMKRWGTPEEVAKVVSCIASGNFSFATGNTIVVDGGSGLL